MENQEPPSSKLRADGEVQTEYIDTNPSVGGIPEDFGGIGYTALENNLAKVADGSDEWAGIAKPSLTVPRHGRSLLTDRHASMESRRLQSQPPLKPDIEPWVLHYMSQSGKPLTLCRPAE